MGSKGVRGTGLFRSPERALDLLANDHGEPMSPGMISRLPLSGATRTVWIFGAGASAPPPYRIPVQTALLTRFATMKRTGGPSFLAKFEELRTAVREHCRRVQPGLGMEDPLLSLEEVFASYELVRNAPKSTRDERLDAEKAISELREAIRVATYVFGPGSANKWRPHSRNGVRSPYAELLEQLYPAAAASGHGRHILMTFNYDICLDRCAINLRQSPASLDVDYAIPLSNHRYDDAPRFEPPAGPSPVLLLRTHGAVNWLRCHACQSVFTTVNRHASVVDAKQCWACSRAALEHVLVHPSYFRTYDDPLIRLIWGRCHEELVRADRWVFIGYSLPAADVHFRQLLRDCLRERDHRKFDTDVVLVDRGPTSDAPFQRAVQTYSIMFERRLRVWEATPNGFADFVQAVDP